MLPYQLLTLPPMADAPNVREQPDRLHIAGQGAERLAARIILPQHQLVAMQDRRIHQAASRNAKPSTAPGSSHRQPGRLAVCPLKPLHRLQHCLVLNGGGDADSRDRDGQPDESSRVGAASCAAASQRKPIFGGSALFPWFITLPLQFSAAMDDRDNEQLAGTRLVDDPIFLIDQLPHVFASLGFRDRPAHHWGRHRVLNRSDDSLDESTGVNRRVLSNTCLKITDVDPGASRQSNRHCQAVRP